MKFKIFPNFKNTYEMKIEKIFRFFMFFKENCLYIYINRKLFIKKDVLILEIKKMFNKHLKS